jgi:non-ribosomal peptide synthetase-like protein
MLLGTPLINLYYRLLGAKIGKRCFIATPFLSMADMITLGDDCSIGQDARLLGYIVEDGWLKIGTISLGDNCFVGARSVININTAMEDNAVLDDMSMLPNGIIPNGQFFSGSPARKTAVPADHITAQQIDENKTTLLETINSGFLHYFAMVFVTLVYYSSFLPSLMIIKYFYDQGNYLVTTLLATPIAAVVFFVVHFSAIYLVKQIFMREAKPGTYALTSLYYLRQWMILKMLDIDEIGVLADSLFFPLLLKKLGARIGKKVEMGEAPFIIPDFLTIDEGGFTASSVAIAWPSVHKGVIRYGNVEIKEKAFIGNVGLLPTGTTIGKGGLLGCMSIPPSDHRAEEEDSAWLGSPPMFLPTREIIGGFPDNVTFNPSKRLYYTRMAIESIRVLLPTTCALILLCNLYYVLDFLLANTSILTTSVLLPIADLGINLVIISGLIGLKWGLLGRVKACIKPLWDVFIWKNDIREFSYGYYINPHLTDLIVGTPFIAFLFRAMGAKIGKRTYIETDGFAEFDLISVGDDVCINRDSLIQTHLYEDRIFKLDNLLIKDGCNIGVGSMVLYNTVMEPNSSLGSFSLLMKGECLPTNTRWEGSPAQSTVFTIPNLPITQEDYEKVPVDAYVD